MVSRERRPIVFLALLAGCGGGASGGPQPPDALASPPSPDAAAERAATADAAAPDLAADTGAGFDTGADTGPAAYVRTEGGPFGLAARPSPQTCRPFANPEQPAALLSGTGCVDPADHTRPAASLIPYDVNSPLWSDGADKQRFLALPDGALIHVKDCARQPQLCKPTAEGGTTDDDGHFQLPDGTVLVKTFLFGGKPLETRLFVRTGDTWRGYSYEWNAAGTDAAIVDQFGAGKPITGGAPRQSWSFPSRSDCLECHNETVGFSLGLETAQLDRPFKYPSGQVADQLATLEHIGVLDGPVARLPPLADPRATDRPLEARVRSYLHANCAICHRPEGMYSAIDLRADTPLAGMNMCNVDPNKGDLGIAAPKRLAPNDPAKSIVLLRMQAADKVSGRMPQLATSVLDPTGIALVTSWIKSISRCP